MSNCHNSQPAQKPWFLYMIECQDDSIYTGIAVDVAARYALHVNGKGARYTRSHPPKKLLAVFEYPDRSQALKAEHFIKQLTPQHKRKFAKSATPLTGNQHVKNQNIRPTGS